MFYKIGNKLKKFKKVNQSFIIGFTNSFYDSFNKMFQ